MAMASRGEIPPTSLLFLGARGGAKNHWASGAQAGIVGCGRNAMTLQRTLRMPLHRCGILPHSQGLGPRVDSFDLI